MSTPRIYTRCPSCGNDTLTINDDKHLLCTWVTCKDPTLIDHPERLTADNARLTAERDAAIKYSERLRGAINGSGPRDVDYAIALEKERDRLTAEVADLKSAWSSDKPLLEDTAINAAHPVNGGNPELFQEALRMVGAKHSKYAIVSLVNWLLSEVAELRKALIEERAMAIYNGMKSHDGWVPWVVGGNSTKQDDCRTVARAAMTKKGERA